MKNLNRIIIACLICSLFLGFACLPINVKGAVPTVAIGLSNGTSTYVDNYIALGAVFYIASGYTVKSLNQLITDTTSWLNSNPRLRTFCMGEATATIVDIGVIDLPVVIGNLIKDTLKQNGYTVNSSITCLFVPTDLSSLNSLDKEVLLGQSVVSVLQTQAKITQTLVDLFVGMYNYLTSGLSSTIKSISDILSTFRTQAVGWFDDINTHLCAIRENITTKVASALANIDAGFDVRLSDVKTALSTFRTQFVEKITDMRTAIGNMLTLAKNSIAGGIDNIKTNISELVTSIKNGITVTIGKLPFFGVNDDGNLNFEYDSGLIAVGEAGKLLASFGSGILSAGFILKQFTDLPYFSSLITISIAIGFVGVLLGIVLDVSSRESAKKTAGQIRSANKAGFNAGFKAGIEKNGG